MMGKYRLHFVDIATKPQREGGTSQAKDRQIKRIVGSILNDTSKKGQSRTRRESKEGSQEIIKIDMINMTLRKSSRSSLGPRIRRDSRRRATSQRDAA